MWRNSSRNRRWIKYYLTCISPCIRKAGANQRIRPFHAPGQDFQFQKEIRARNLSLDRDMCLLQSGWQ